MNQRLINLIKYTYFYCILLNKMLYKLINYTKIHEKNVEVCKIKAVYKLS